MNFLKVKNWVLVFLISFFISIGFVSAKTLEGSVYFESPLRSDDYRYSINLFEESKDYSPFVQFLYNQGFTIGQYLNSYFNIDNADFFNDKYNYSISIFKDNDLRFIKSSCYTSIAQPCTSYNSTTSIDYINNLKDSFTYLDNYSKDDIVYYMYFNLGQTSSAAWAYDSYLYLNIYPRYIFVFNSAGIPIGYKSAVADDDGYWGNSNSDFSYKTSLKFEFPYDNEKPDITSWYFYLYYATNTNFFTSSTFDKIYPRYFYFNGSKHTTSDNAGYTALENFWQSVKNGFSSFQIDFSKWNMQFIYDDVFYKEGINFVPIMKRWYSTTSYVIPSNYTSINISDSEKGYYLIPKRSCSSKDYNMYFTSDSYLYRHKLYFTYYKFENNELNFNKSFNTFSTQSYKIYSYNPLVDLGVNSTDYLNYALNITQSNLLINYLVYYNSSCYNVYLAKNTDITLEFDNGTFILSANDLNDNFLNNNTTQYYSNSNVTSNPSTGSSNAGADEPSTGINVSDIISNIGSYASGIIKSVESLVGIATVFLTGLPPMIYEFLFAVFAIGMIIFIIKLIK